MGVLSDLVKSLAIPLSEAKNHQLNTIDMAKKVVDTNVCCIEKE